MLLSVLHRNSLVALKDSEALFARVFIDLRRWCAVICVCVCVCVCACVCVLGLFPQTKNLLPPLPTRLLCLIVAIPLVH